MENGNQPAFAQSENWQNDMEKHVSKPTQYSSPSMEGIGLTKREYFAGLVMQGLLANPNRLKAFTIGQVAEQAVTFADALLAELDKQTKTK